MLDEGQLAVDVTLEVNLAHNFWAEPLSLAPDVWWGVTPKLTVGLVHSNASVDRFAPGSSLCLRTDDGALYCDALYRGSGIDARYLAVDGDIAIAPRMRVLLRDVDPFKPAITLGALAKWQRGRMAVTVDPYLQLGLANTGVGNRAQIWIPVQLAVQPTCRWQIALHTGWNSEVATVTKDGWHIPIALGVQARATTEIDLGATLGFASLLGPQNTPKQRVLFVTMGWRR